MSDADKTFGLGEANRLQLLVDSVVDYAIYMLDLEGRVISWNSGAVRLKGYTADEIIGERFSRFYTPEDQQAGIPEKALRIARETQRTLKAAQEQLAVAQKMEAVGQLSGGIAHDFNNLLMIVIGNLETAQHQAMKPPINSRLSRALGNAMRGAQRAAALTGRLLAFSRRQALDPKPMDVNKFLSGASDFLQRSLGEKIQIETVGAAGLWNVEVDHNQLESALVNLAINARDAMPNGGKLTIEGANVFVDENYSQQNPELKPGQYVAICVSDTGAGMPSDVLNRAFNPFSRPKSLVRERAWA